ncbi:MAG: TonB-dependent receptor domain-containing protein [Burkholderiaceae bacterium]
MIFPILTSRTPAWKPLALASAVTLCTLNPVQAQTNNDKTLAPVMVTASRFAQNAKDVLSDNTVITAEEIQRSGQTSLIGLLQQKKSIQVVTNGGPGASSSLFTRGTDNKQSIVLIDGVRTSSLTNGGASWSVIPLTQIDRIEIVYGPLSSLYGADAVGGVIQIFTKKGQGTPQVTASAGIGSEATRIFDMGISGASGEEHTFRYALGAAHEASDGFSATKPAAGLYYFNPDNDGYKKDSVNGQFSIDLAKGHELGLRFLHSRLNTQFDAGLGYDDRTEQEIGSTVLYSNNRILTWWNSQLQLSQSTDKSYTDSLSYGNSNFDSKQTGISWQNDVTFGSDILQLLVENRKEEVNSSESGLNRDRTTNSIATSYQLNRGNHLASIGLRNDDNSQFGSEVTGSVGYGYRLTNALRANASYGTSFRAPTFNDLYYPGYGIVSNKPEHGKNSELALHYDDGTSQLSAVYYRNRVTDLLGFADICPIEPDTHPYGCTFNVNQATLKGLSLSASTRLQQFTIKGSLDFLDPHDDSNDKILARRAKRHASMALEYRSGLIDTGVELLLSGERFDDVKNKNTLGGYSLLNLYASYDFAPDWSLFGRWNNVLNKDYELARNYATSGSSLFVGVRYAMK